MTDSVHRSNPRIDNLERVCGMLIEVSENLIRQNINQYGGPHGVNRWLVLLNEARAMLRGTP